MFRVMYINGVVTLNFFEQRIVPTYFRKRLSRGGFNLYQGSQIYLWGYFFQFLIGI